MRAPVIFVFSAVALLGALSLASDSSARGGGGGRGTHGGMAWGLHWHGLNAHGMHRHMPHFASKGHQHQMHGMPKFGHNMHHYRIAQGQWHSFPGFGSHGQKFANMQGVWHKAPGFGRHS